MGWGWGVAVALAVCAATVALTGAARHWLEARAILDRPVARSSHSVPVPRGGGIAVMPGLILGWLAIAWQAAPPGTRVVLAAAAALAALSWRDDVRGLAVTLRLLAHGIAVLAGLATLDGAVFQGALPPLLDRVAAGLLWLWFVELYNFMDGIDGITGVETVTLGGGLALVLGIAGAAADGAAALALACGAAGLGFLRWNW
jgi:UDP-N-acetylmuramyl pentapeptide phosphotransferase/UDP-N-acetylglucosamine-1-phosphate transferase